MSQFPLAEVTDATAVQDGNRFILYVEALTSGFGGRLHVWHRPTLEEPPSFFVFAEPGNDGFIPSETPQYRPTKVAAVFEGAYPRIHLHTAKQILVLNALNTEPGWRAADKGAGKGKADPSETPGWSATHNFMPLDKPRLSVSGCMMMPTPGYKLTLVKASPQGINPNILLLQLHTERPSGNALTVLTPTPVSYVEETSVPYRSVQIEPGHIIVPVMDTH